MTLTDLPELLPLLKINCAQNTPNTRGVAEVQQLIWGDTQHIQAIKVPDVILLADCIYYGEVGTIWTFGIHDGPFWQVCLIEWICTI